MARPRVDDRPPLTAMGGRLRDLVAACATAALWAATLYPLRMPWLAPFALVPWILSARAARAGEARAEIASWVVAQYALHIYVLWWTTTCAPPLAWLVPLLGVPFSILTAVLWRAARRRGMPEALAAAGAVVGSEVLRDTALQGLTWSSLGYATEIAPGMIGLATVGRVHLPALVVVLLNVLIADAWTGRGDRRVVLRKLGAAVLLVAAAAAVGAALLKRPSAEGPRAVGLQANIPQFKKRGDAADHVRAHFELLQRVDRDEVDLLVFAETSFPVVREPEWTVPRLLATPTYFEPALRRRATYGDLALRGERQTTLLGIPHQRRAEPGSTLRDADHDGFNEWNVAWVLRGGRPTDEVYRKRGLAPFGEYLPVGPGFPGYSMLEAASAKALGRVPDLLPGDGPMIFTVASPSGPFRGATTICFEMVFPKYFREAAQSGADFVVNLSNDAWFDDSAELDLVDQATRWRAVECGRAVFRVSNSGISTLFGPDGTRVARVADAAGRTKAVAGVLVGRIPIAAGETFFVKFGDLPWLLFAAVWLGLFFLRSRRFPTGEVASSTKFG